MYMKTKKQYSTLKSCNIHSAARQVYYDDNGQKICSKSHW